MNSNENVIMKRILDSVTEYNIDDKITELFNITKERELIKEIRKYHEFTNFINRGFNGSFEDWFLTSSNIKIYTTLRVIYRSYLDELVDSRKSNKQKIIENLEKLSEENVDNIINFLSNFKQDSLFPITFICEG